MLIDKLDKYYSILRKRNKLQSLLRFLIREFSIFFIPIYLKISRRSVQLDPNNDIIVSLTTFPARINTVWMVIECMVRQDIIPSKIILWLSKEQFPNQYKDIPRSLLWYVENDILTIKFEDDDLRSHKKYYYALLQYPLSKIIVVDDDIFYPSNIIRNLINIHQQNPEFIVCLRAYEIIHSKNGELLPYNKWTKVFGKAGPNFNLFHTSGGGTLYHRSFFDNNLFDKDVFMDICRYADDVWLNIMAQKAKTKTIKCDYFSNLIPIKSNSIKLSDMNVFEGENDKQIENVIKHYKLNKYELFK